MSEKKKLIVLKIVRIVLQACMTIMSAIEAEKVVDKSVLDQEIPLSEK